VLSNETGSGLAVFATGPTFSGSAALFQGSAATVRPEVENPDTPADDSFADSPEVRFTGTYDSLAGAGVTRAELQWAIVLDMTTLSPPAGRLLFQSPPGTDRMALTDISRLHVGWTLDSVPSELPATRLL